MPCDTPRGPLPGIGAPSWCTIADPFFSILQAKELVERAPVIIMEKVKKEEATKIAEKLKTETGAEVELI